MAVWENRRRISRIGAERSFKLPLHSRPPGKFLDIACGLGFTVRKFADEGWDAHGIDADPTMRKFHVELDIKSSIGQIEATVLDGKFDIIQIGHAIYFITNPHCKLLSLLPQWVNNLSFKIRRAFHE